MLLSTSEETMESLKLQHVCWQIKLQLMVIVLGKPTYIVSIIIEEIAKTKPITISILVDKWIND